MAVDGREGWPVSEALEKLRMAGAEVRHLAEELRAVRARERELAAAHRKAKDAMHALVVAAVAAGQEKPTEIAAAAGIQRGTLYFLVSEQAGAD